MAKITFNGAEYDSPEDMPPEARRLYEMAAGLLADKDGDGTPDVFQGAGAQVVSTQQFVVDGAAYASLDDVPDEARERLAAAMAQVSALQGQLGGAPAAQAPQPAQAPQQLPHVTVVGEGGGGRARLILLAVVALAIVAAAAYWLGMAAR